MPSPSQAFAPVEANILKEFDAGKQGGKLDLQHVYGELNDLRKIETPKDFQADLDKLNKDLHDKKLLPEFDIIEPSKTDPTKFDIMNKKTGQEAPASDIPGAQASDVEHDESDAATAAAAQQQQTPTDTGAGGGGSGGGGSGGGSGGGGGGGDSGGGGGGRSSGGGGGGGDSGGGAPTDNSPVSVPNLPDVASGDPSAVLGNHLLTNNQQLFAEELAKKTGLDPNVIGAWVLNEESGGAAHSRDAANNNDWLNIGYTDSGQRGTSSQALWFSGPVAAADATAAWMKGQLSVPGFGHASQGIQDAVKNAVGKPPGEQIALLQNSGWASGRYPNLPNIYQQVASADVPHNTGTQLAANTTASKSHHA